MPSRVIRSYPLFNPRQLFAVTQGAWYEPRLGFMWQENTGVTPTTSSGQTIGKLDDLSGYGNNAIQATLANRPTLQYSGTLPFIRYDSNDVLTANLPNIGGGVFSSSGSVYFATPQGMSVWNNQSMSTSYNLPALSTDWYSCVVLPARLPKAKESQLERYMLKLAGLIEPDYLLDDTYAQLLDDESYNILRA